MTLSEAINIGLGILILAVAYFVRDWFRSNAKVMAANASTIETNAAAAAEEKKMFYGMVADVRSEMATVRAEYRDEVKRGNEQEIKIRELLERLADLPKLERDIEKLRSEVAKLVSELDQVKEARVQREKELAAERQARLLAEGRISDMQTAFVKERGEWQIERGRLNEQITSMSEQLKLHDVRLDGLEVVRQTPATDIPAVTEVSL